MSILIKGVAKPEQCECCAYYDKGDGWCFALREQSNYTKCPIIEVHKPCDNCQEFDCYGCKWREE